MATNTASYSFLLPTVGGDTNLWGGYLNSNWEDVDDLFDGTTPVDGIDIDGGSIDGTPIGATTPSTGIFTTLETTTGASFAGTSTFTGLLNIQNSSPSLQLLDTDQSVEMRVSTDSGGSVRLRADFNNEQANSAILFEVDGTQVSKMDEFGHVRVGDSGNPTVTFEAAGADAILIPVGTTAQRPSNVAGHIRRNSTTSRFEGNSGSGYDAFVEETLAQTLTNKTFGDGTAVTTEVDSGWTGTEVLDPVNGLLQEVTLTGNVTTLTDNLADGESVVLHIDDGTAYTITWPTITWVSGEGSAPTLQASVDTVVTVWKAGTTLFGFASNGA